MQRVTKTSPIEKSMNSRVLDIFMFSFIEPSLDGLKDALHDEGSFLGCSKSHYLAKIQKFFYALNDKKMNQVIVNRGICLDTLPGADVLEIRYRNHSVVEDNDKYPLKKLGQKADPDEYVLRFAILFEDGKINRVCKTRHFVDDLNYTSDSVLDNKN